MIRSIGSFVFVLGPLLAYGAASLLPQLPAGDLPNTEVSTNIVLAVDATRLEKLLFAFDLADSPSNNLQVAIGQDVNEDGDLSLDEADLTFGYDCGVWFTDETEKGVRAEEPASVKDRLAKVFEIGKKDYDARWNLLKYTRRGVGTVSEVVEQDEIHLKFTITIR